LDSAPAPKCLKKAAPSGKTWDLANKSNIKEENSAIFDVNITVKTAEATKKQDAQRVTPMVTVKLPVLTICTSLPWNNFLKVLAEPLKTSPTSLPMYMCEWKKTMAAKTGLPLLDEGCFAALKCQFKPLQCFVTFWVFLDYFG
jgi:hypothetical protein